MLRFRTISPTIVLSFNFKWNCVFFFVFFNRWHLINKCKWQQGPINPVFIYPPRQNASLPDNHAHKGRPPKGQTAVCLAGGSRMSVCGRVFRRGCVRASLMSSSASGSRVMSDAKDSRLNGGVLFTLSVSAQQINIYWSRLKYAHILSAIFWVSLRPHLTPQTGLWFWSYFFILLNKNFPGAESSKLCFRLAVQEPTIVAPDLILKTINNISKSYVQISHCSDLKTLWIICPRTANLRTLRDKCSSADFHWWNMYLPHDTLMPHDL